MDEFEASLALRHTPGLGPKTWKRLLTAYGNAAQAVTHAGRWSAQGLVSERVQAAFLAARGRDKARAEAADARDLGLNVLCFQDAAYPDLLREIPDPPIFLYYHGDISLLSRPCVAVVGSRQPSRYGLQMAERIARTLSQAGICVVSGFAYGIDRAAHLAALDSVGGTVAVLGTGLDLIYPAANKDVWTDIAAHGLIITEFAPGTKPDGRNFPYRNRIVSALSLGVLVVEGALRSGSLITAELALSQNREVFALPGPATADTSQGCHQLIRQGACLIQSGEDIVRELAPQLQHFMHTLPPDPAVADSTSCQAGTARMTRAGQAGAGKNIPEHNGPDLPRPDLPARPHDPDQQAVYDLLLGRGRIHIDTLARQAGWPAEKVSATLVFMELHGIVQQLPGMYYTLEI